jgi:hypothetical protein
MRLVSPFRIAGTVVTAAIVGLAIGRPHAPAGGLVVRGTPGADTLVVSATGPDSGSYSLNGAAAIAFGGIEAFTFEGGDGNDTLRILNPEGGLFAPTGGIFCHGGDQAGAPGDALENLGGSSSDGSYVGGPTPDAGILRQQNGAVTQVIEFTGLEPILDTTPAATLTVDGTPENDTILLDDGPTTGDGTLQVAVNMNEPIEFANKTNVTITGLAGTDTITVEATEIATGLAALTIDAGVNDDTLVVKSAPMNLIVNGGDGTDTLTGPNALTVWSITGTNQFTLTGAPLVTGPTSFAGIEALTGGTLDDTFAFANGAGVSGTINGGGGTNRAEYTAYTTPVSVNLGLGITELSGLLGRDQENPPTTSPATGTAAISNYNVVMKTFDITVTVSNLAPAAVTGFHIHRAPVGVNGPIIIDFIPGGVPIAPLVPMGDGFTFTATGLSLATSLLGGVANEAALLGGITYVNVHTAEFPGGATRGQLFSTGNVNLGSLSIGTATGAGSIANISDVAGGSAGDSLVGNFSANVVTGGEGGDTMVPGPGADQMIGNGGNDVLVWSNGDGSDLINGDAGSDTVQVNGALAANDVFTIAPSGTRIDFDRISPGPFSLDIGTVETLTVNGVAGNDTITVNDLSGVGSLATLRLNGFAGIDKFAFNTASSGAMAFEVQGGPDLDELIGPSTGGTFNTTADNLGNVAGLVASFRFIEKLTGGSGADTFNIKADSTAALTIAGGDPTTAPGDTLNYDREGRAISGDTTPPDGMITSPGVQPVTFTGIEGVSTPHAPPTVTITSPTASGTFTATSPFLTVAGTASDDSGIGSVSWTNDRGGSGVAVGTTNWTATGIPLQAGVNIITITADDQDTLVAAGAPLFTGSAQLVVTVNEFVYFLAEGATGDFFDLDVLIGNPNLAAAAVLVEFLKEDGTTVQQGYTVPPQTRLTIPVDEIEDLEATAVSTVVHATEAQPLIVERTMRWDDAHFGAHGGTAVEGARTRWLFAEGSQGFFDTFVLLANANLTPANVTLTFLREFEGPVVVQRTVGPLARQNVWALEEAALVGRSFSIVVESDVPIIAERAMYFPSLAVADPSGRRGFEGGHAAAGVTEPATSWFHAEGATGAFFDTYILVGNANSVPANVTFTWLLETGQTVVGQKTIPANTRLTVPVDGEDPLLADAPAVSTTVTSDVPVISERAMYWTGDASQWFEAHDSFGVTATATKWGLSEGRVGGPEEFGTFILLANPTGTAAELQVTYIRESGAPVVKTYTVGPTSRKNIWVNVEVSELVNESFGAVIEVTNGVPIAVERAMYNTSGGVLFAAGTNATAVKLP